MPWTPDEEKRFRRLEEQAQSNRKHIEEIQSRLDRDLDGRQHAWSQMLDGAKTVLTSAFQGQLKQLAPRFDQLDQIAAINRAQTSTLEDLRKEIMLSREERIARKAREDQASLDAAARDAARSHRLKVAAVIVPLVVAVIGALAAAGASHFH